MSKKFDRLGRKNVKALKKAGEDQEIIFKKAKKRKTILSLLARK